VADGDAVAVSRAAGANAEVVAAPARERAIAVNMSSGVSASSAIRTADCAGCASRSVGSASSVRLTGVFVSAYTTGVRVAGRSSASKNGATKTVPGAAAASMSRRISGADAVTDSTSSDEAFAPAKRASQRSLHATCESAAGVAAAAAPIALVGAGTAAELCVDGAARNVIAGRRISARAAARCAAGAAIAAGTPGCDAAGANGMPKLGMRA